MDVKKCDRCGTVFPPSGTTEISYQKPEHTFRKFLDLCTECWKSFKEWANEKKVVIK
jgi:hypothetical protein